ncbi:MAG: uncharacterized protein QOE61_4814 [Micromonosporaceae bacterium]|nr:uncharacterized protein [Micromonosporaceae bacterium]
MTEPDLALELVGLARVLRRAGVAVDPSRVALACSALIELAGFGSIDRELLYHAIRAAMCSSPLDLATFETAYRAWLGAGTAEANDPLTAGLLETNAAGTAEPSGDESDATVRVIGHASAWAEHLAGRDIATLGPYELAAIEDLIAVIASNPPTRHALRYRASTSRDRTDLRRTLRSLIRQGEMGLFHYRQRMRKPRRVLLVIDVSESMAAYSDAMLHFAYAAARAHPGRTEVFTVGTRLTQVTSALAADSPQAAMQAVGRLVEDRGSGTRLGRTLRELLAEWGSRPVVRSAVAVVMSDGWSKDETVLVAQIERLTRLAHRTIWVTPLAANQGYEPQSALARSRRHLDALMPGHSLTALRQVAQRMAAV